VTFTCRTCGQDFHAWSVLEYFCPRCLDAGPGATQPPAAPAADPAPRPELTPDDCLDDDEPERTWPIIGSAT
jgi:hypothetical protein